MGASGFSISFTPSYGSGLLTRTKAGLFYTVFIIVWTDCITNFNIFVELFRTCFITEMIHLTREQFKEIVEHCQGEYPKEACGILAGIESRISKVYKMANTSDNPDTCYFMKPEEQLRIFKEMRHSKIEMLEIYHSHSNSPAYPSQRDCEMAFYPEVDYVIISLKDFNNPEVRAFKITEGKIEEEKIIVK